MNASRVLQTIALVSGMSLCTLASAQAAKDGTPTTGPATGVTQTTAVLHATFLPGGVFATIGWGPASTNKGIANCGDLPTKSPASCTATNLTCSTKYGYRASQEMTKSGPPVSGARLYFTTAACSK